MNNSLKRQPFGWLVLIAVVLFAPSAFADERDRWRTGRTDDTVEVRPEESETRRGRRVVEGVVEDVSRSGNRFDIETSRGEITVLAPASVPIVAGGRTLRARDLRQGDRVRVSYDRSSRGEIRATRIQVLSDVSRERRSRSMEQNGRRRREIGREERERREVGRHRGRESSGRYDREDRGTIHGTVVSVNQRLDTFDVRLDDGRSIRVDAYPLRTRGGFSLRSLESGSRVRLQGEWMAGGTFRVERVTQAGDSRSMRRQPPSPRRQQMRDDEDDDDSDEHRDHDDHDDDDDDDEDEGEEDDPHQG